MGSYLILVGVVLAAVAGIALWFFQIPVDAYWGWL